jgi:subtilase family serine protease
MKIAIVAAVLAAAATAASAASASPYRPAAEGLPFTPLTRAAVQQAPTCQNGLLCYTPQMVQQAYDFPTGAGAPTGAGQTVVVVVAYGSPFLAADVAAFDQQFGLPAPSLTEYDQQHVVTTAGSNDFLNWGLETSLDVEYVHAMAPGARIVLAVAATDDSTNFVQLEREVLALYPNAIVTQSFGGDETGPLSDPASMGALDALFLQQVLHGGTIVAASGDLGASDDTPFLNGPDPSPATATPMASYPASSPFALAVGGTEGNPYPGGLWQDGHYGGEQVWNEVLPSGVGASGGAPSTVYPAPIWQLGVTGSTMRAEPDVAYDAAANGGVIISFGGRFGVIGGTSAAAPQWAAIVALGNELRQRAHRPPLGIATPYLYLLARDRALYHRDFHDITVGTNALFGAGSPFPGFDAGPGYDYPTGLGTPDVSNLLGDLASLYGAPYRLTDLLRFHGHGPGGHVQFGPGR